MVLRCMCLLHSAYHFPDPTLFLLGRAWAVDYFTVAQPSVLCIVVNEVRIFDVFPPVFSAFAKHHICWHCSIKLSALLNEGYRDSSRNRVSIAMHILYSLMSAANNWLHPSGSTSIPCSSVRTLVDSRCHVDVRLI